MSNQHAPGCPSFRHQYGVCSCGAHKLNGPAGELGVPLRSTNAEKSHAETQPSRSAESTGLSFDMTDVDRLRDWARNIDTHGPNLMQWASPSFLVMRLRDVADRLEVAVRDIGALRKLAGATPEAASLRAQIEQLPRTHKDYYDRPMCSADCDVPEHYNVTWADVLALLDATETTDDQT